MYIFNIFYLHNYLEMHWIDLIDLIDNKFQKQYELRVPTHIFGDI